MRVVADRKPTLGMLRELAACAARKPARETLEFMALRMRGLLDAAGRLTAPGERALDHELKRRRAHG